MSERPLTPERKADIDTMTHEALCRRWRFAPLGDDFWQGECGAYAKDRLFQHFGGFTPTLSKRIGWGGGFPA